MKLTMSYFSATVAEINRNITENLLYCGPALIADESTLKHTIELVTQIITKKHICQMEFDDDDDVDVDETSEADWAVIGTALDVVTGLAAALGPSFAQIWKAFEKPILRYVSSSESLERSAAVGALAECINGMGEEVTPFTATFLRLLVHRLADEDPQTKSNAAYGTGRLIEKSDAADVVLKDYPVILTRLEPCVEMNVSRLQDNASGCLSRMILKHRESVPIKEVLPVLVTILPLKNDYEENDPVYRMICQMCKCSASLDLSAVKKECS